LNNMQITKSYLKRIIQEETNKLLNEWTPDPSTPPPETTTTSAEKPSTPIQATKATKSKKKPVQMSQLPANLAQRKYTPPTSPGWLDTGDPETEITPEQQLQARFDTSIEKSMFPTWDPTEFRRDPETTTPDYDFAYEETKWFPGERGTPPEGMSRYESAEEELYRRPLDYDPKDDEPEIPYSDEYMEKRFAYQTRMPKGTSPKYAKKLKKQVMDDTKGAIKGVKKNMLSFYQTDDFNSRMVAEIAANVPGLNVKNPKHAAFLRNWVAKSVMPQYTTRLRKMKVQIPMSPKHMLGSQRIGPKFPTHMGQAEQNTISIMPHAIAGTTGQRIRTRASRMKASAGATKHVGNVWQIYTSDTDQPRMDYLSRTKETTRHEIGHYLHSNINPYTNLEKSAKKALGIELDPYDFPASAAVTREEWKEDPDYWGERPGAEHGGTLLTQRQDDLMSQILKPGSVEGAKWSSGYSPMEGTELAARYAELVQLHFAETGSPQITVPELMKYKELKDAGDQSVKGVDILDYLDLSDLDKVKQAVWNINDLTIVKAQQQQQQQQQRRRNAPAARRAKPAPASARTAKRDIAENKRKNKVSL
jgi:hypothetical protein